MAACWRSRRRWCSCTSTRASTPAVDRAHRRRGKARDVATRAVGQSVLIVLPDDLPQGTQIVSYRVVSQDGHPVAGSMVFSIGAVTGSAPPTESGPLKILIWLARIGVYLGLFVGVGGAFFAAWIGQGPSGCDGQPRRACHRPCQRGASLGLQGLDLLNLPLGGTRDVGAVGQRARHQPRAVAVDCDRGDGASPGTRGKARACLIAWVLTTLAMVGVGLSLATSGHAATASPQWLTAAVAVPARRRRGLLGRRVGAAGSHGASARRRLAARAQAILGRSQCRWSPSWC